MGRLRTNTDAPKLIKQFPNFVSLNKFKFPKTKLFLEIGSGKGDFLIQQAIKNPKIAFLGIEKYSTVVLKALKKVEMCADKLPNLFFSCLDVKDLDCKKFKNKVSKIFLNFSDPWPKKRHAKRRLTSSLFLDLYKKILKHNSLIEFKTDNENLYNFTLEEVKTKKYIEIVYKTRNLYKNLNHKMNKNNVQTEYEKKFVQLKKPIYKLILKIK